MYASGFNRPPTPIIHLSEADDKKKLTTLHQTFPHLQVQIHLSPRQNETQNPFTASEARILVLVLYVLMIFITTIAILAFFNSARMQEREKTSTSTALAIHAACSSMLGFAIRFPNLGPHILAIVQVALLSSEAINEQYPEIPKWYTYLGGYIIHYLFSSSVLALATRQGFSRSDRILINVPLHMWLQGPLKLFSVVIALWVLGMRSGKVMWREFKKVGIRFMRRCCGLVVGGNDLCGLLDSNVVSEEMGFCQEVNQQMDYILLYAAVLHPCFGEMVMDDIVHFGFG
ncbi:hypothetical protein CPB84DRAFT_1828675 [Gymnopilus junonius]|uniref:Uncharacterized protein n=1 Tax=Gymnopilus junonius TaxID=109634 RepID=A0A9P5NAB9_GYMJU|nr:hypothetical protein CPB84DRAFT_1828675 [Gymnopilus junonius]